MFCLSTDLLTCKFVAKMYKFINLFAIIYCWDGYRYHSILLTCCSVQSITRFRNPWYFTPMYGRGSYHFTNRFQFAIERWIQAAKCWQCADTRHLNVITLTGCWRWRTRQVVSDRWSVLLSKSARDIAALCGWSNSRCSVHHLHARVLCFLL